VDVDEWSHVAIGRWQGLVDGAERAAQHITSDIEAEAAIREVLKYPFKVSELADEQVIEVLAAMKGLKHHQVGGAFHGSSRIGRVSREIQAGNCSSDFSPDRISCEDYNVARALALARMEYEAARPRPVRYQVDEDDDAPGQHSRTRGFVLGDVEHQGRLWRLLTVAELRRMHPDATFRWGVIEDGDLKWSERTPAGDLLREISEWKPPS
jgi:hypothetical protein